nr:MAG TPA: hypothetical protein [Bacteriophage sp.]
MASHLELFRRFCSFLVIVVWTILLPYLSSVHFVYLNLGISSIVSTHL